MKELILNKLIFLVATNKIKTEISNAVLDIDLSYEHFFDHNIDSETGYYFGIMMRGLYCNFRNEHIDIMKELLLKHEIISRKEEVYIEDEDSEDVVKIDIEIENGNTVYALNGYEIFPTKEELIYKYVFHPSVITQAKELYEKYEKLIDNEKHVFSFKSGSKKYFVSLFFIDMLYAFLHLNSYTLDMGFELLSKSDHITYKKYINKIPNVDILKRISHSKETLKVDPDWRTTVKI